MFLFLRYNVVWNVPLVMIVASNSYISPCGPCVFISRSLDDGVTVGTPVAAAWPPDCVEKAVGSTRQQNM